MSATGASIIKHPDREEINERFMGGESLDKVLSWLKRKYAQMQNAVRKKKLIPSRMTLQAYRRNFLNVEGEVLKELKKERTQRLVEERKRRAIEKVHASEHYQLAKAEYAEGYVAQIANFESCLQTIYVKVNERIAIMESQPTKHLNDKVIVEQCNLLRQILRDYFDMQQALKVDSETNINIDLKRFTEEVRIIKAAIRETINELCPEILPAFLERLREKIDEAKYDQRSSGEEEMESANSVNINIKG